MMEWQPIETAPKDKVILAYRPDAHDWGKVAPAKWDDQRHHKKPQPFWSIWLRIGSTTESRAWVPTHWMPLPDPPNRNTLT